MTRSALPIAVFLLPLAAWGDVARTAQSQAAQSQAAQSQAILSQATLSQALSAALDNSPAVRASQYMAAAASARIRDAGSGSWPQALASAGYTRYQEDNTVVPIHAPGVFPPLDDDLYHAGLQVRLSLFDGGRRAASQRAARAGVEEAGAHTETARIGLIEGVAQVFVRGQELADRRDLIGRHMASLEHRRRELGHLLGEGRVAPADVAMVEAALEEARADCVQIEGQQRQLAIRLGRMVSAGGPVALRLQGAVAPAEPVAAASSSPGGEGPQVAGARARGRQTEALQDRARRARWPELSGFATYGVRAGDDLDGVGEWLAGVQLTVSLFDGGRRGASVAGARAAARAAGEQVRLAQQLQEMEQQLAAQQWQSALEGRRHMAAAVVGKTRSVAAHRELYREGRIPLSELMIQETEHLQLQLRERSLAYEQSLALLRQHAAAGTLTQDNVKGMVRNSL